MGMPPGKRPPRPEVTSMSPTRNPPPSRAMYLKRSVPRGSPSMMPGVRVRTTCAPTLDAGSVNTCTMDEPARTSMMRPTRPSGAMTAVSRTTESPRPRLTVSERTQPPHSRAMISPAIVSRGSDSLRASSRRSRWFSASVSETRSASTRSRCASSRSRRLSLRTFFQSRYVPQTPRVARLMRARTVCTGVVTTASASEASPARPRICSVRSIRQTPAMMPSSANARILTSTPWRLLRLRGDRDLLQQIELVQHLARPERDARQRIFARRHRQVGLLPQQVIEAPEQRAAARDHDAFVHDVGCELWRRALQAGANGLYDRHHGLPQRFADLLVGDHDRLGNTVDEVTPLDFHRATLPTHRIGRAEGHLDLLRAALAHEQVVVLFDVLHDRLVHLVAGDADRLRVDDARQRNDGHLGGSASDVDDHVAAGLLDRQPSPDGGGHRLFDQVDLARARLHRGIAHRALFDLRDPGRNADDDARPHECAASMHLGDEVMQHLFGDVEVGDDAVLERPDGDDVARRSTEHRLRLVSDGQNGVVGLMDRDDRGFVEHDPFAADVHQGVRSSEIHREVIREHPGQQVVEHRLSVVFSVRVTAPRECRYISTVRARAAGKVWFSSN